MARTPICQDPIIVKPRGGAGGRHNGNNGNDENGNPSGRDKASSTTVRMVADHMLLEEARTTRDMVLHSVYNGSIPDLMALLRQLTSRLNEDQDVGMVDPHYLEVSCRKRTITRQVVVETLKLLPLRSQVELVQVLRFLSDVVNATRELNEETLLAVVDLLEDITIQAGVHLRFSGQGMNFDLDPMLLTLGVKTTSSVMTALAESQTLFRQTKNREGFYRKFCRSVTSRVEDLLALQLQVHSVGEEPIQVTSPFMFVQASHLHTGHHRPFVLRDVQFQLPNTSIPLLNKWSSPSSSTRIKNHDQKKSNRLAGGNKDNTRQNIVKNGIKDSDVTSKIQPQLLDNQMIIERERQKQEMMNNRYVMDDRCFQSRSISFHTDPNSLILGQTGKVQTAVASLNLYSCDGLKNLKVNKLPDSELMRIDIQRQLNNNSKFGSPHYLNKIDMNVHELMLGGLNEPMLGPWNHTDKNRFLHIHILLEEIPPDQLAFPLLVLVSYRSVPYNMHSHVFKQIFNQSERDIKVILPATSIKNGKLYSVGLAEASFNSGRRRNFEVKGLHYNLSVWWDTCVFWNDKENVWSSEGCQVLETSNLQVLHCSCSHLTMFGGYFDLIPHHLTVISVEEFFSPHENPLIIVMVGTVLLAYVVIVLMIQPGIRSNDDAKRRGRVIFLQDNCSSHRQKYEIILETGFHPDAGTTSKVSLILHGDESVSETRELTTTDNVCPFERNSRNRFIITLPESPGRIVKIQLWHNNYGSSPGWFLRQAIIRDLNSGQTFYFLCQKWLAVDRDDGKVEREFPILDGSALKFSQIFMCKGSQYLSDLHTWLSIFTCPPDSHFTSVQRLSLCLAMLMTYMGLAAVWFHLMPPAIRGEFGLLDLSWRNVLVGFLICCLMFPVNIILSFLFRRSCKYYESSSKSPEGSGGKSGLDLVSQGEEDIAPGTVPYSILDQSILNWQHIQEWAHRQWQKRQGHVISINDDVKDTQNIQHQSSPSMIPLVQQTMLAGEDDVELGSSGFEDATSQATAERNRIIATSETSSVGKKSETEPSSDSLISKRKLVLPWWCRYIAWVFCFFLTAAGALVTVWYGFRFSHNRSVMWIQSVYFSLITCIFIVQPAMILLKTLYTSLRHRHNPVVFDIDRDSEDDLDLEWEERRYHEMNSWQEEDEMQKGLAARSRSRYLRFAGPLQGKQLKSSRRKMLKEKRALALLSHGSILSFLTLLLVMLTFGRNRGYQVQLNQATHEMFAGSLGDKSSFVNLKSLSDWHKWSRNILIPSLSSIGTLSKAKQKNTSSELGVLLGNAQLRQFKVKPQECVTLRPLGTVRAKCFHDYSGNTEDESYNGFGMWKFGRHPGMWGYLSWYEDTGFVIPFSHNRDELVDQLDALKFSQWLDHRTRAVLIEMTIYNPPSRLYSSITLLLEVSASGKVLPSAHIRSSQLFHYVTLWEDFLLAAELILLVIVIVMLSHTAQKLFHQRLSYFKQIPNAIEIFMSTISTLYVMLFIYRFVLVMETVEILRSSFYETFVSFAFLALWDEILHTLLGLLLFCVLLKWICWFSYNPRIARLLRVYKQSKREILLAAGLFAGQIIAFSSLGHLLFGFVYQPMCSFVTTAVTVTALSARTLRSAETADSFSAYLLTIFSMFTFVFLHGIVGIYIFVVLAYRLKASKIKRHLSMPPRKLLQFYWQYFSERNSSRKYQQHQESENTLSPEFIMAEILYLVEELLFRMNNLLGTSGLPEKQHSFSDSDSTPDVEDDGISTGVSEDLHDIQHHLEHERCEVTDLTRLEDRVHRIEDKLCSNEPYLAQLLKLDSFGTNILSEEEELELRSQLEFEIFQQLQKQRQETNDLDHTIFCLPSESKLESPKNMASPSNHEIKDVPTTVAHKNIVKQVNPSETSFVKLHSPKKQTEIKSPEFFPDGEMKTLTKVNPAVPNLNTKSLKRSQSLKVPVRDTTGIFDTAPGIKKTRQGYFLEKDIDSNLQAKLLMNRHSSVKGKKEMMAFDRFVKKDTRPITNTTTSILKKSMPRPAEITVDGEKELVSLSHKMSSGNVSPQSSEGERGHKRTDSSSGQSGPDTRLDTPKMVGKRLDLPPRPTFTHNTILSPPKARPLDLMGEWTAAESSSGSEQETGLGPKRMSSIGRRNLRKTKSRGKGKGNDVDIDSAIVLTEDFHSGRHRGISDCSIIIHPVPANVDLDEISIPEEL